MTVARAMSAPARVVSWVRAGAGMNLDRDARWSLLLTSVAVYLITSTARLHIVVPQFGLLRPTLTSAVAALVLIVVDHSTGSRLLAAFRTPGVRWMFMLVVWAILSIPLALWSGGAADIVINGMAKAFAMLVAIIVAVRGLRDIRRLVITVFLGTVVLSAVVLVTVATDPSTGRFARLEYYDQNELALLAACIMPFGAYAVWLAKGLVLRVAAGAALAVVFMTFMLCGSRGAVVALAAGLTFALLSLKAVKLRWRVAVVVLAVGGFVFTASDQFMQRIELVDTREDYNFTSPTGRVEVWKRGLGYMLDHPVLGVGAGNFATAEGRLSSYAGGLRSRGAGQKWSAAHNSFVQVGAELGVPGLVLFCAALFGTMIALWRIVRATRRVPTDPDLGALAQVSLLSLVIFATGNMFLSLAYSDMLFALLAIGLSVLVISRSRALARAQGLSIT